MSTRRLLALVAGLPPDAAVNRDGKQWTSDREVAARTVERVDYWGAKNAELLAGVVNWKQRGDRDRYLAALDLPERVTHPERQDERVVVQRNVTTNLSDLAGFIGRHS